MAGLKLDKKYLGALYSFTLKNMMMKNGR